MSYKIKVNFYGNTVDAVTQQMIFNNFANAQRTTGYRGLLGTDITGGLFFEYEYEDILHAYTLLNNPNLLNGINYNLNEYFPVSAII
jgi:hypothetical protein